jgi:O-antigen ligase
MQQGRRRGTARRPGKGFPRGPARRSWTVGKGDFLVTAAYLIVAALFGGGLVAWSLGNIVLIVATIVLAVALAWRDAFSCFARVSLASRLALAGIAVLPLLQLVPLPPTLWQALPGQELRRATLGLAGLAGSWQPVSLEPGSTALCAVMAIGFVALVGWLLRLSDSDFRRLLLVALALVAIGILVGLLQVVSDGQFPQLQADNMGATLLGFYANKNHMGLVLACSILIFNSVSRGMLAPEKRWLAVIGYSVFALVAIVATNSRAGLSLGILASVIVLIQLSRGIALRWRLAAVLVVAGMGIAIMSSSAFQAVSQRVDEVGGDLRWRFLSWTWPLAKHYGVLGSGFGSFETLFITHEQLAWVKPTIVNAVHNDYLQLLLEGGLPGVAVLLLLIVSVVGNMLAVRTLSRRDPRRHELFLGLAMTALFALHSAVDYPLRRPGAWIFMAIALAAIYRARAVRAGAKQGAEVEAA